MSGADQDKRSFADKLAFLIETVHPADRGPYSYREIAAGVAGHPGAMTAAYVHQLVKGKQLNPRIGYVEALASFFGVPVTYFVDDEITEEIEDQIAQLRVWRDDDALRIAERVVQLGPRDRHTVTTLIESLHAYDEQPGDNPQRRKPVKQSVSAR
jgi:transcriptional regulator with XRE-family HTH domain